MPYSLDDMLVVAISSRALFDLEAENIVYERDGEEAYRKFQFDRLNTAASEGIALPLVRKLLSFNTPDKRRVEIVILSRNDPVSGLRVFRSVSQHSLDVSRGAFTKGEPPYVYLKALRAGLFLSADDEDVRNALNAGVPAARVYAKPAQAQGAYKTQLRIAFDGDAVLFGDEGERVFKKNGLQAFLDVESEMAKIPLSVGPFKPFLESLHRLQKNPPDGVDMSIRTALVTARNAPAHERAIRTLMAWNVEIDEAFLLGGLDKGEFLEAFQPDFFFDDQTIHCQSASRVSPTGHVAYGIANEIPSISPDNSNEPPQPQQD